jgi:hypothetical protein
MQDQMNPFQQLYLLLCSNNIRLCPLPSYYKLISSWPYSHLHKTDCATVLFSQLVAALGIKRSIERLTRNSVRYSQNLPIPVAARSKTWVWGLSLAGITASNPAGSINMSVVSVVCCQAEFPASGWSLVQTEVLPSVVCLYTQPIFYSRWREIIPPTLVHITVLQKEPRTTAILRTTPHHSRQMPNRN